jgi:DNA invertase Pin-like site-specific DNA recombinase
MKKCVIYLRVSTLEQVQKDHDPEGYSIPAQREACQRKAESLGADVVAEFIDRGESARSADRPQLQAMLAQLKADKDIDYCLVHKVDRLARNRDDDFSINLAIRAAGTQLVSATENIDATPSGKLLHGIMATIAEFYSGNLATEVIKGMTQKAKNGGTLTIAPIGYINARALVDGHEVRTVVVDPERAPLVKQAFEMYATGEYSLIQLADIMTARGLLPRSSKRTDGRKLRHQVLAKLLHNAYFCGVIAYRGVLYEGRHESLVSKELFEQVQRVLKTRSAGEKQRTHNHYLKSTLYCGRCGSRMCLASAKQESYLYYFCAARPHRHECDLPYVHAEDVEQSILEHYRTLKLTEAEVAEVRDQIRLELASSKDVSEQDAHTQKGRLRKLQIERSKLLQAYYSGAVTLDVLADEQGRINRDTEQAEGLIAGATRQFEDIESLVQLALDLLKDCDRFYRLAPDTLRRRMNQALFERVSIDVAGVVQEAVLMEPFKTITMVRDQKHRVAVGAKSGVGGRLNEAIFDGGSSEEASLVRLICQLQEGGFKHTNLEQLYRAVMLLDGHSRPKRTKGERRPLRSMALLALDMDRLVTDHATGIRPYSLAIKYGIDRETVAKRLRDFGVRLHLQ